MGSGGNVIIYFDVTYSYGDSPERIGDTDAWHMYPTGSTDYHNSVWSDSDGRIVSPKNSFNSPITEYDYMSCNVNYVGYVSYDSAVYWDSCGIFISMIYYECDIDILYITITFYFLEVFKYET